MSFIHHPVFAREDRAKPEAANHFVAFKGGERIPPIVRVEAIHLQVITDPGMPLLTPSQESLLDDDLLETLDERAFMALTADTLMSASAAIPVPPFAVEVFSRYGPDNWMGMFIQCIANASSSRVAEGV